MRMKRDTDSLRIIAARTHADRERPLRRNDGRLRSRGERTVADCERIIGGPDPGADGSCTSGTTHACGKFLRRLHDSATPG